MSDTTASLRRKIESANDLQAVVRTMKASAAASVGQYERSVLALGDYYRGVELGLGACFRQRQAASFTEPSQKRLDESRIVAIVFGSDQGLVGQFNDAIADFAAKTLSELPGKPQVWAVGERAYARLDDNGLSMKGVLPTPSSIQAITPLVAQIETESGAFEDENGLERVYVFHNRPTSGTLYEPVSQRLLPLDSRWQSDLAKIPWPTKSLAEVLGTPSSTLGALVREYLFISLFRACSESLASENASRLAAMQRADKNIADLLEDLQSKFRRKRQSAIDEELFDVTSGFEALST